MTNQRYQYQTVVASLKRILKNKRITYEDLAGRLGLSESGVKKIMSGDDISLGRLGEICAAIAVDLLDLLEAAWRSPPAAYQISAEQAEFFAANPDYYRFHIALFDSHFDVDELERTYDLDRRSTTTYLGKLEALGLIEVLADRQIRSVVEPPYRMQSTASDTARLEINQGFLALAHAGDFDERYRKGRIRFAGLRMTPEHFIAANTALRDVLIQHGTIADQDELAGLDDELVRVGILIAMAPFEFSDLVSIPRLY